MTAMPRSYEHLDFTVWVGHNAKPSGMNSSAQLQRSLRMQVAMLATALTLACSTPTSQESAGTQRKSAAATADDRVFVRLSAIHGIPQELLDLNRPHGVKVNDPVLHLPDSAAYVFSGAAPTYSAETSFISDFIDRQNRNPSVLLTKQRLILKPSGVARFEFAGDAETLEHFLREAEFLREHSTLARNVVDRELNQVIGAKDNLEATVGSLVGLIQNAALNLHKTLPRSPEEAEVFTKEWLLSMVPGYDAYKTFKAVKDSSAASYLGRVVTGDADPRRDVAEFVQCLYEERLMSAAESYGLNYFELRTDAAKAYIEFLAKARLEGAATAELALMFFPWTAATKAAASITKVGRFASVFKYGSKAEFAAVRAAKFRAVESRLKLATGGAKSLTTKAPPSAPPVAATQTATTTVTSLQKLQPLLNPQNIITLASPRALNSRFRKVLHWLHQAESDGHDPSEALWRAMKMAGADKRVKGPKCTLNPTLDHAQIMKEYNALKGSFGDLSG